jgi:hypothetical protein
VALFADIEGSARLSEEHIGVMGAAIAYHDAIPQEQIEPCDSAERPLTIAFSRGILESRLTDVPRHSLQPG